MSGKLKNLTRVALTLNLTTKVAPLRRLFDRRQEHKNGEVKVVQRRVVIPDSVTVLAGKESGPLPDGVPHCPEVVKAIAARKVKWTPLTDAEEAEIQAAAEKAATEDPAKPKAEEQPRPRKRPQAQAR